MVVYIHSWCAVVTASQQLNATGGCGGQSAVKIADGIVALFYDSTSGGDILYYVETRTISAAGAISAVIDGPDEWGDVNGASNFFAFPVSGTIYACSYREGSTLDGWVNTFNISATGTITAVDIDTFEFETVRVGNYPKGVAGGVTLMFFYQEYSTTYGLFKTVDIDASGNIGAVVLDTVTVDGTYAENTDIFKVSSTLYLALWYDNDGYGQAASLSVESVAGLAGIIAIVDTRLHYLDKYGVERYIEGTAVS